MSFTTILFYKYIDLDNPEQVLESQKRICTELNLKGRTIIGQEGINGTLEGNTKAIDEYIKFMRSIPSFDDILFKKSESNGQAFPKLSIKVRNEVVTTDLQYADQLGPHRNLTGKYLSSEQLHDWINDSAKEFYIIDMRNDYEHAVGHFAGSILPKLHNFRDLPKILPELEHLKNKTIVTTCTGGIRCEKASGFLIKHGFQDVYQLKDGIVTYMEKYPNQDFLGKLYVFDKRVVIGFELDSPEHVIVGKCVKCAVRSENLTDFYEEGIRKYQILCPDCIQKYEFVLG